MAAGGSEGLTRTAETDIRERVLLFLIFLGSESCQSAAERVVPRAHTAFALCRLWFDDVYWPSPRYMDGFKGDPDPERTERFESVFDVEELVDLERFHAFLELRLDMLSARSRQEERFPESDLWRNVMRDARYLAESIEPDQALRTRLEGILTAHLASLEPLQTLNPGELGGLLPGARTTGRAT